MKAIIGEERGNASNLANRVVRYEFGKGEPVYLIVLLEVYKGAKVLLQYGIEFLYLTIYFRVISGRVVKRNCEALTQSSPEL